MMSRSSARLARAVALVLGASAVGTAAAQEPTRQGTYALEEVTVTAQRRLESAQSVPISLTALDAGQIEKSFSRDIQGVANLAPNLIVDPTLGNGTTSISIRGMQLNDVEKSFDPAVAVYLDGIYLANTTGALMQMFDAEAVEVLRGPQGTLFGRNTIGGLIHIRRAKPTGEFGGKVAVNYGRYDQVDARAVMNFPSIAGDTLATKLSLVYQDGGGYFENVSRGKDEGDTEYMGVTFSALWEPNDDVEAVLTFDYFDDDTPTRPVTALTQEGELFCNEAVPFGCGEPKTDGDWHRKPTTTLDQKAYVETTAITLNASWQVADAHKLVLVSGWRDVEDDAIQEFDGVAAPVFWTSRPQTSDQFSAELRLESDFGGSVRSVVGAYYFNNEYELNQRTDSPAFFGDPNAPLGIAYSARNFTQEVDAYALFAQVDWNITDQWILSLGGRYSEEKKTAAGTEFLYLNEFDALVPIISYGNDPSRPGYQDEYEDPITGETKIADGDETFSKFTPRVNLTYKIDDSKLVYATYSKGYRSGGFNGRASGPVTLGPYDPEEVETIEIGAKTQWMDNRLRFNAALFTTDYTDKQEDVVFPDPVAVTVTLVQNAGAATIDGAEFELVAVPIDGLTLGFNLGLLDASYDKWTVPGFFGGEVDKSGFELRRAPEYTAAFNAMYEQSLQNGAYLVYSMNYSYKDDYYVIANTVQRPEALDSGKVDAFGLLDASITYDADTWSVSLWGKNLTDEDYFLHVLDVGTNYAAGPNNSPVVIPGLWTFGTINPPRTYGIEVQYKF